MRFRAGPLVTLSSVAFTDAKTSARSWAGVAIGTAAANRFVVVVLQDQSGTPATGVTIDGNAMTLLRAGTHSRIFGLAWPTGTTATIDASTASSTTLNGIHVYALYGLVSLTPAVTVAGSNPSISITPNVAGGVIIAAACTNVGSITLTGITQDTALNPSGNNHFRAGKSYPAVGGANVIGVTPNLGTEMCAAYWSPYQ